MATKSSRGSRPRSTPSFSPEGMPFGVTRSIKESIEVNKDTLAALTALGKAIPRISGAEDQFKKLGKLQEENENLKKENERLNKQLGKELHNLVKKISKTTGMSREEVSGQMLTKDSDVYKRLPLEVQKRIASLDSAALAEVKNNMEEQNSKIKEFFSNTLDNFKRALDKNSDVIKASILGPFSLLVSPLEEFFGGDAWDIMKGGFAKIFGKKDGKKRPTISDLVKKGEIGALFLANKLEEIFGKKDKDKNKKGLLDMLKVPVTGLAGTLMKAGAFAAIIGSLIMAVVDGIKGMKLAEMWGTGKVAGFIGGFLGGTEKGWKGAFKNAGKWALMGVGVGFMTAGPIGAIIGGLLGGAIGGILGFIGGENIAKFFQKIFNWGKSTLNKAADFLKNNQIVQWITESFKNLMSFFGETLQSLGAVFKGEKSFIQFVSDFAGSVFKFLGNQVDTFLKTNPIGQFIDKWIINPIVKFFQGIGDTFAFFGSMSFTDLIKTVTGGSFGDQLTKFKSGRELERNKAAALKSQEFSDWLAKGGGGIYAKSLTQDQLVQQFLNTTQGRAWSETNVNDAIIRPDGTVIHTHPDDTIIATKNNPSLNGTSVGLSNKESMYDIFDNESNSSSSMGFGSMEKKLDKMISLLSAIVNKEPIQVNMPKQTMAELDLLINGAIL